MKTYATTLALACALTVTQRAAAQDVSHTGSPWYAGVVAGPRYHLDGSRDAFSGSTVGFAAGLLVSRDVLPASSRWELAVELGAELEADTGELHQAWRTSVSSVAPFAGVSVRFRLLRWLLPYLRVNAGGTWHEVSLDAMDGSGALTGGAWGFQGSAGLGLMFQTGTFAREGAFRRVRFAFTLEGGAVYAAPVTLEVEPRAPSDEREAADRLPVQRVRLGELDASASYIRLGVGLRF